MKYFALLFCFFIIKIVVAQDTIPEENTHQRIIEDIVEQIGGEDDFDFNTQFDQLQVYLRNPINLNRATIEDLTNLSLLSPLQVDQFFRYKNIAGNLIAIEELQAIPSFDLATIEQILPYVTVKESNADLKMSFGKMLKNGDHTILSRMQTTLEQQEGYKVQEGETEPKFVGNPYQFYTRYQYNFNNQLTYGVTLEKDAGETFGGANHPLGFGFYSAHFGVRNLNKTIENIVIGDFEAKMGQGLALWTGFGFSKSSYTMNVKRISPVLRSYRSVNEFSYLRGGGITLNLGENIEVTTFVSYKNRDANIIETDTIDQDFLAVSSLQISGLHRTESEIAGKNAIQEFMTGANLRYNFNTVGHIGLNTVFTQLSKPLILTEQLYNQFRFQGDELLNISLDYSYVFRNFNFFGETAVSNEEGWATLNGLLISLTETIDLSILHRNFQKNYQTIYTNNFSETNGTNNEIGTYVGLQITPNRRWQYSLYADSWRHPWLRFQVDAPSNGYEYFGQVTYKPKRGTQVYLRLREETKQKNANRESATRTLFNQRKIQTRLHFQHQISKTITIKSRVEWSHFEDEDGWQSGYMMYQDLSFKPFDFPFSFTTRYALFDTDSYDTRIYAFENDVLNAFSVPPYYNKGSRFYINLNYRGIRNLLIQARFARTR
ncbi:MAG: ComEA family DNA-binding protein, partial [Saprospiraceae bacterium]